MHERQNNFGRRFFTKPTSGSHNAFEQLVFTSQKCTSTFTFKSHLRLNVSTLLHTLEAANLISSRLECMHTKNVNYFQLTSANADILQKF